MEEDNICIENILKGLVKRIKVIIIITIICFFAATIISFFLIEPKYETSTKLFIGKEGSRISENDSEGNYNSSDIQMYEKIIKTYADVIETKTLINKALLDKNLKLEEDRVIKNLKVIPKPDTQILEIRYVSNSPKEARDVIEAITEEFIDYSQELIPNSNVQIVEDVYFPKKPISPNKILNMIIGIMVGIIVGCSVALIENYIDRTFGDKEEVEKQIGLPVLGDIPNLNNV